MTDTESPFRPTAGGTPPEFTGSVDCLTSWSTASGLALELPACCPSSPAPRGIGRAVMLGAVHGVAREHGWAVISQTADGKFG